MFDYLRNLTKSAEEKQQEALNAYLDNALSSKERQQFEQLLTRDADLRLAVEERRALQMQMRQMPRRPVPRNFMLDPALYGRPQRQPLFQLYPAMRVATVLTALFLIVAIGTDIFLYRSGGTATSGAVQDVALLTEEVAEEAAGETALEAPLAAQVVEETRVVTEMFAEEAEIAAEAEATTEAIVEEALTETQEEPALPPADTLTTTAEAANEAEAGAAADQEPSALAPQPTPTPEATLKSPEDIDATASTIPRLEEETAVSERVITAVPTDTDESAAANQAPEIAATAVPAPTPVREPISGLRWLQIGLGVLLILLVTAVFYVRRQTF